MSGFHRYAIYYLPDDEKLSIFGAKWLGWDIVSGTAVGQFDIKGLSEATETPRKYGFHGTLKPPFRLSSGSRAEDLAADVAEFAQKTKPVTLEGLRLAQIGSFLALVPVGRTQALDDQAMSIVRSFDAYRHPPTKEELARRRARDLTAAQDANLVRWGYPYVGDSFRFHLTLTGRLSDAELKAFQSKLETVLPPLPVPFEIASVALVGEDGLGRCQMIERYALGG